MLVDAHVHVGRFCGYDCPEEKLLRQMDAHGIGCAVVSDLGGNVLDASGRRLEVPDSFSLHERMLERIGRFPGRFQPLYWVRPLTERPEDALRYLRERPEFIGLKTHPFCAGVPFDDPRTEGFCAVCRALGIPFWVHSEEDGFSDMRRIAVIAEKHPDVDFVAVHGSLRGDHAGAFRLAARLPNLWIDTTLMDTKDVLAGIADCGAGKVLFGSDAPVLGDRSYDRKEALFGALEPSTREELFFGNFDRLRKGKK